MPNKAPEDRVQCPECSLMVQRRNLNRHRRIHLDVPSGATDQGAQSFLCRSVTGVGSARSRSSSRDSLISTSERLPTTSAASLMDVADNRGTDTVYRPSTDSLIGAARAILHQRNTFTEEQLCAYVAQQYPEIPVDCRRYLVIGAVSGAQYAACQHHLWRDNARVADLGLRRMASDAASILSCWTLGFRPSYNMIANPVDTMSHNVVRERAEESSVNTGVPLRKDSTRTVDDLQLPVTLSLSNEEFERVLRDVNLPTNEEPVLAPEISTTGNLDVAARTDVVPDVPSTPVIMADPSSDGIGAAAIEDRTSVTSVNELTVPVNPAAVPYSPGNQGNIEYNPTPIVVLKKVAALKQKCKKNKSSGKDATASVSKPPQETTTAVGSTSCEQSTRVDEALELHAPAEIDSTPEPRNEAKFDKSKERNTSKNVASVVIPKVAGNPTGSANQDSRKPDKPQPSISRDRRPQNVVDHRERSPRSPTRREGVHSPDHRERSPSNRRDGLYRLTPEEYAMIERRRNQPSSVYRPTYRRK